MVRRGLSEDPGSWKTIWISLRRGKARFSPLANRSWPTAVVFSATWDLGGLVAARGEISAASEAAERARRRAEAVKRATTLYYDRRRALLALLLDPPLAPRARAEAELEVDRITAELDALTGGLLAGAGRQ